MYPENVFFKLQQTYCGKKTISQILDTLKPPNDDADETCLAKDSNEDINCLRNES